MPSRRSLRNPVSPATTARPERIPAWFLLGLLVAFGVNYLATLTTGLTIGLMGDVSEFAQAVRAHDHRIVQYYNPLAFAVCGAAIVWYLWPVIAHFRCTADRRASAVVERRTIGGPLVVAAIGFVP